LLGQTYVSFTSDIGYLQGEHRIREEKVYPYEASIRVPLLIRGPGIPPGVRSNEPAINADLAPTIAGAAGAEPGLVQDGLSLLDLLDGSAPDRDLLIESFHPIARYAAVRTGRYLYAEHASGSRELYDLATDPFQLKSRHADPDYAEVRRRLSARLSALRDCAGESCLRGLDLELDATKQELRKKVKFFATASSDSTLVASGKAIVKTTKGLAAWDKTKVRAKLKRAKRKRLANKLDRKGKAKTKVRATATDQRGAEAADKVQVKFKD
jgi:hypothetical protein